MYLPFGFSLTPWVKRLIAANVVVFVLTSLFPPLVDWLAFAPALVLVRPWTIVTYMFVHGGFLHILFNMIVLFFFGPPLEQEWGAAEFLKFYFACGLGGALFSFIFAPHTAVIGASAAIFGVMLAFAMIWPNSPIYIWGIFPIKAKWLVLGLIALQLFSVFHGQSDGIAHFAHLGGVAVGFLYLKLWPPAPAGLWGPGTTAGGQMGPGLVSRLRRAAHKSRLTVVRPSDDAHAGDAAPRHHRDRASDPRLDELDRVLDKISKTGMGSLTPDERRLLDDMSRRYRQN